MDPDRTLWTQLRTHLVRHRGYHSWTDLLASVGTSLLFEENLQLGDRRFKIANPLFQSFVGVGHVDLLTSLLSVSNELVSDR
jgi:hypothetical protein